MKKKLYPFHAQLSFIKIKITYRNAYFPNNFHHHALLYFIPFNFFFFHSRNWSQGEEKQTDRERKRERESSVPVSEKRTERREKRHITSVIVARARSGRPRPAARGAATLRGVRTPRRHHGW